MKERHAKVPYEDEMTLWLLRWPGRAIVFGLLILFPVLAWLGVLG